MSDSIKYAISVEPREELSDEQANTHTVISGEVGKSLGGSGVATVTAYDGTAAAQGYLNATVNYLEAPDGAGGEVAISTEATASYIFIKNTGYVFSSATALGVVSTRSVKVTASSGTIILSILDAGEPFTMKDDNAGLVASGIKVETVDNDGTETAGGVHNAIEYLVVD